MGCKIPWARLADWHRYCGNYFLILPSFLSDAPSTAHIQVAFHCFDGDIAVVLRQYWAAIWW